MAKKSSAKQQAKAERRARQEAVRQAERRRNIAAAVVVVVAVATGGALISWTLYQERQQDVAAAEELEALQSEAAAEAARLEDRPVACGADVPTAAAEGSQPDGTASEAAPSPRPSPDLVLEEGVDYRAVIETSCGTLQLDLAEDRAPEAVNAFVSLARSGFYDGLEIFRNATSIGALQTGAATNEASFDIGYTLPDELDLAQEEGYPPGAVAMANAGPDTAGSQFFFVYNDSFDTAFADNRAYTRFATVTEGLDVLQEIGAIEAIGPTGESPAELVYMESVQVVAADDAPSPAPSG